ncbi:MAG: DHHW family protein [Candidatus Spyradocola sp.]
MKKAICIGFVAVLFAALLLTLLLPDQAFSDMENRYLAKKPEFSLSSVLSGKWMNDMETYLADQFPGRTFFVRTKATINYLLGQREIGGAYLGADGQLFEVFDKDPDADRLDKNAAILSQFASAQTGSVYFLPVYSAFTLYPDRLPAFVEEPDEREILLSLALPDTVTVANAYDALIAHRSEALYFRTDHHWTQDGAYLAYEAYCAAAGLSPVEDLVRKESAQPFYGSLFSKAPIWGLAGDRLWYYEIPRQVQVTYDLDKVSDSLYTFSALEEKDQYRFFLDGNHARVDIETDAGTGRTLVVLQDSFAHALIPFLANHYDRIVVLDLRYYNLPVSEVLQENPGADILLTYNLSWLAQDQNLVKLLR